MFLIRRNSSLELGVIADFYFLLGLEDKHPESFCSLLLC